jgi:hypothetical protein
VDCLETLANLCGAEVDVIDANGCSPLFYAVTLGHSECTKLLLKYGAQPNRQDRKGRTYVYANHDHYTLILQKFTSLYHKKYCIRKCQHTIFLRVAVMPHLLNLVRAVIG